MDTLTSTAHAVTTAGTGHRVALLVTGGTDGLMKVLSTLRSRRWAVRDLRVDLSGEVGRVEGTVEFDGRDADLLLEQLRRVVPVVRAEHG